MPNREQPPSQEPPAEARRALAVPGLRSEAAGTWRSQARTLLAGLRSRLRRRATILERRGELWLAYEAKPPVFLRAYQAYCRERIAERLEALGARLNVSFGDARAEFGNSLPTLRVGFQTEHTLVRSGGRDSAAALPGRIPIGPGPECYQVRVARLARLLRLDLVVDYSRPNLVNVATTPELAGYLEKTVHVAPLLDPPDFGSEARATPLITLFGDLDQPRRRRFFEQARRAGLPLVNIKGCFDRQALRNLYHSTRVLVNVHQTDHHDTLEELRVLPALLSGVVVVSEEAPLRQHIPYAPFLLWSSYENLVDTARRALEHHGEHYRRLFGGAELGCLLASLERQNRDNLDRALAKALERKARGRRA